MAPLTTATGAKSPPIASTPSFIGQKLFAASGSNRLLNDRFPAIMTTLRTNMMHLNGSSAILTGSQCRNKSFVVSSSLVSALLRNLSFRIWHGVTGLS